MNDRLARAQELVDSGNTAEARQLLDRLVKKSPKSAEAHLLRSTVHFVEGDLEAGRRDLDRAIALDPSSRQAWINRGALDLSEQRYESALEAFQKGRTLAPEATENALNIGAVLLLMGRLPEASQEFQAFLAASSRTADALYLVATNYAMAGYAALSVEFLKEAIEKDERARLKARTDPNFSDLARQDRFERLLGTDTYTPPPGAYQAARTFDASYGRGEGLLLEAVLDSLLLSGQPFDRRVEVTPGWALIWGPMRIKISQGPRDEGLIQLSAPPERFTPAQWTRDSQAFFEAVTVRLHALRGLGGHRFELPDR